jgi:hypothetical protein
MSDVNTDTVYAAVPKKLITKYSSLLKVLADPPLEMRTEGLIIIFIGFLAFLPSALGVAEYTQRKDKEDTSGHGLYVTQCIILSLSTVVVAYGIFKLFMSFEMQKVNIG